MKPLILLCRLRHPVLKHDLLFTVILHTDPKKRLLLRHRHMDQPLLRYLDLLHTLDRIIQHISKQRTDIHLRHTIQQRTVRHTRQPDPLTLTVQTLRHQHRIKHLVARLILRLIRTDLLFHLLQILRRFLRIRFHL